MDWKSIGLMTTESWGFGSSRLKACSARTSFQDEIPRIIRTLSVPMMLQILVDNLLGDLAGTPGPVADPPEVPAPVALLQRRILLQEPARRAPLDPAHDLAERVLRRIRQVQVHMIGADDPLEDTHIEPVADLPDEVSTTLLDLAPEHPVTVLRAEDHVDLELVDAMAAVSLLHAGQLTESLVLKHVASTSEPRQ